MGKSSHAQLPLLGVPHTGIYVYGSPSFFFKIIYIWYCFTFLNEELEVAMGKAMSWMGWCAKNMTVGILRSSRSCCTLSLGMA